MDMTTSSEVSLAERAIKLLGNSARYGLEHCHEPAARVEEEPIERLWDEARLLCGSDKAAEKTAKMAGRIVPHR